MWGHNMPNLVRLESTNLPKSVGVGNHHPPAPSIPTVLLFCYTPSNQGQKAMIYCILQAIPECMMQKIVLNIKIRTQACFVKAEIYSCSNQKSRNFSRFYTCHHDLKVKFEIRKLSIQFKVYDRIYTTFCGFFICSV